MRPVIRKAEPADLDAVTRIWHSGWIDGHLGHVPPELVAHRSREQFASRARKRLGTMWVAESDGQAVGFVVVKEDEVEQLFVDRAARGTGVAALLMRRAESDIRSAGHRRAWLAVVAGNQRARSFYSRLGWRDTGAMSYEAETETGPIVVPTHRYEIDLEEPLPGSRERSERQD
jgi:putative acetyltransferase